ncbi:hypothetical protein ACFV9D_22325 [Streptomyces sp. NPDC059875]|uniref:hypothetical protein n=1 Tax=unclassified Streptomyces TaxID=2593676 RepID=UPI003657037B
MADERYQWLDQEAAERLLRGEPVDAVDDHTREQAERLARVLASARPLPLAGPTQAVFPGEEAALAAFRKAAAERGTAASPAVFAPTAAELDGVRLGPVPAARQWGRSLRYGLAAAVAAVAVGGVAVASGTGMLPFDSDRPTPAGSVSAVEIPDPVVSGSADDGFGTRTPSVPPAGEGRTPGASPSLTTPPATAGSGGTDGTGGGHDATPEAGKATDPADRTGADLSAKTVKLCQDFRAGRLDDTTRRRLTESVRTGETVQRFCDRVLTGGTTGGTTSGATREPSSDSSGGKDDGKGDDGSSGEGERAGATAGGGRDRGDGRRDKRGDERGDKRDDRRDTARDQGSGRAHHGAEDGAKQRV